MWRILVRKEFDRILCCPSLRCRATSCTPAPRAVFSVSTVTEFVPAARLSSPGSSRPWTRAARTSHVTAIPACLRGGKMVGPMGLNRGPYGCWPCALANGASRPLAVGPMWGHHTPRSASGRASRRPCRSAAWHACAGRYHRVSICATDAVRGWSSPDGTHALWMPQCHSPPLSLSCVRPNDNHSSTSISQEHHTYPDSCGV